MYSSHKTEQGRYRAKQSEVEAFRYDGDLADKDGIWYVPAWAVSAYNAGMMYFEGTFLLVETKEGKTYADNGDYIIKDMEGYLKVCKPELFHALYKKKGGENA